MKKIIMLGLATALLLSPSSINLKAESFSAGDLIKAKLSSAVYYYGADNKRYVFPNQKIFNSWYADFLSVKIIEDSELADILIGGNVFYKPNSRLVKITSDPKVYWVNKFGKLQHVADESVAIELFGESWASLIDDMSDAFFAGYSFGEPLMAGAQVSIENSWTIANNHQIQNQNQNQNEGDGQSQEQEQEQEGVDSDQQPASINLTVTNVDQDVTLEWFVQGGNTNYGFIVLKSIYDNPTYPEDESIKLVDKDADDYIWQDVGSNQAFYFRVCRLNSDGSCGTYSDTESIIIGAQTKTPQIILSGVAGDGVAKLSWQKEWLSPNDGFILMRGNDGNLSYPKNAGTWFWLAKEKENYDWQGISAGTYHFRICRYTGETDNGCQYYSNDLELTIE